MASDGSPRSRPWTVHLLVAASLASLTLNLFLGGNRRLWDIAIIAISLWWTYALWSGKSWAFSLSFMTAALCAALSVGIAIIQALLLEMSVHHFVWWALFGSWFWVFLLIRPETKRFAGLEKAPREGVPAGG